MSAKKQPVEPDIHALGFLESRARQLLRQLRAEFGTGGTRELLERIQNDLDEREMR